MIGITIGSYAIAEKIGSGGVGDVYRATDPLLERVVAIKFMRPDLADRGEVVSRFHAEARALAQLMHPNIALLYCLLREGPHVGMVMEFVEGRTFAQILREAGRLAPERALPLILQALEGIGHAHRAGIVHRDIKPSNLMLATSGCVKVMDFGIARFVGSDRATRHGHTIGTLQYMSPEQVRGQETDARSDVYALGVVMYELLTGRLPFDSENDYELGRAHVEVAPRPPRQLAPELSPALEAVVLRMLEKDPARRFQGMRELRDALLQAAPGAAEARFATDTDALPTRELEADLPLVDAEPLDLPATRVLRDSTGPDVRESRVGPPAPQRTPGHVALACTLALVVVLGVVAISRAHRREEPPTTRAAAVAAEDTLAAAPETRLVSTPAAVEPSAAARGGSGWVIRRR